MLPPPPSVGWVSGNWNATGTADDDVWKRNRASTDKDDRKPRRTAVNFTRRTRQPAYAAAMGCAGSNPIPTGETVAAASNGHAAAGDKPLMADDSSTATATVDKNPQSIVQKVVGNVKIDDVVKKIQGIYHRGGNHKGKLSIILQGGGG